MQRNEASWGRWRRLCRAEQEINTISKSCSTPESWNQAEEISQNVQKKKKRCENGPRRQRSLMKSRHLSSHLWWGWPRTLPGKRRLQTESRWVRFWSPAASRSWTPPLWTLQDTLIKTGFCFYQVLYRRWEEVGGAQWGGVQPFVSMNTVES